MLNELNPKHEKRPQGLTYADAKQQDDDLNRAMSTDGTFFMMPQSNVDLPTLAQCADEILYGTEPAFRSVKVRGQHHFERLAVGLHLELMTFHFQQVSRDLEHAPHIERMLDLYVRHPIRLHEDRNQGAHLRRDEHYPRVANDYVQMARSEALAGDMKRQVAEWQRNAGENEKTAELYLERHFAWRSSLLIVCKEFTYAKARFNNDQGVAITEQVDQMSMDDLARHLHGGTLTAQTVVQRVGLDVVIKDRNELFAKLPRKRRVFGRLVGYLCVVTWSRIRGYFLRCLFLFDRDDGSVADHKALDEQIAEYWINNVTGGRGDLHVSEQTRWSNGSVRVVERHDLKTRAELLCCLGSSTRVGRYVRVKRSGRNKMLTMGRMPPPRDTPLGAGDRLGAQPHR